MHHVQRWILILVATSVLCSCRSLEIPIATVPGELNAATDEGPLLEPPLPTFQPVQDADGDILHQSQTKRAVKSLTRRQDAKVKLTAPEPRTDSSPTRIASKNKVQPKHASPVFVTDNQLTQAKAPVVNGPNSGRPTTQWAIDDGSTVSSVSQASSVGCAADGCVADGFAAGNSIEGCITDSTVSGDFQPGATVGLPCPAPGLQRPHDEYICDGGDQQTYVDITKTGNVRGLNLEDTVMFFESADQKITVHPSNRVCIYSPRFASVRHLGGPSEERLTMSLHTSDAPVPPQIHTTNDPPLLAIERLPIKRELQILTPTGFKERIPGTEITLAAGIVEALDGIAPQINFEVLRTGMLTKDQQSLISAYTAMTTIWTDANQPQVMIEDRLPAEQVAITTPEVVYQFDLPGKPAIRLIKLASVGYGAPGDIVEFAIRFDNFFGQAAENVTIVDNLTTRLEYIPDTEVCSVPAEFTAVENEGHSLTVSWKLKEALEAGEGGVIRFKCRIR